MCIQAKVGVTKTCSDYTRLKSMFFLNCVKHDWIYSRLPQFTLLLPSNIIVEILIGGFFFELVLNSPKDV